MKEKERFKNILITGPPGSGKTTLFNKIITYIMNASQLKTCNIAGFITKEIREKEDRVGFNIENFSGEKGILAHINNKNGPVVGKYKVNLLDLENIGIRTLKDALNSPDIILVAIDEIGKMEMFHPDFLDIIDKIISSSKMVLATISYKNKELLQKLKSRNDTYVLDLTYLPKDSEERKNAVQFIIELIYQSI